MRCGSCRYRSPPSPSESSRCRAQQQFFQVWDVGEYRLRDDRLDWLLQDFEENKLIASSDEWFWRLALAKAIDHLPSFSHTRRQASEIAVARNDAETVHIARVKQVHRINDEGRVRGVLTLRIGELLDRLDRVAMQMRLPAGQVGSRPVPVRTFDRRCPVLCDLLEQFLDDRRGCVVRVDQYRQACGICICQGRPPVGTFSFVLQNRAA
ncbi:hypothetical protein SAMN05518800_6934 [Variovorax sp. YR752]|nr:hypothetical protein SAMN05518800_6934 [Variovorax sp. YR752]